MRSLFHGSLLPNVASVLMILFIGWFVYEAAWPFRTIEFAKGALPLPMVTDTVETGSVAALTMTYCKYTSAPASIARQIRYDSGQVITLPEIKGFSNALDAANGPLCQQVISASTSIPDGAPTGRAKIRLLYRYPVSLLQIRDVYVETTEFPIVPKKELTPAS
jgi:hypothetical protein